MTFQQYKNLSQAGSLKMTAWYLSCKFTNQTTSTACFHLDIHLMACHFSWHSVQNIFLLATSESHFFLFMQRQQGSFPKVGRDVLNPLSRRWISGARQDTRAHMRVLESPIKCQQAQLSLVEMNLPFL